MIGFDLIRLVAVYDASVLSPSLIRNLLMHLAAAGLVTARWTDEIHAEWTRNLLADRPDLTSQRLARTRRLMEQALPGAGVSDYAALIPTLRLPDADDRHVVAAAITAQANYIVTLNLKHFPADALEPYGVAALTPDALLCLLLDSNSETLAVLEALRASLRNPAYTWNGLLRRLEAVGLPMFVEAIDRFAL